MLAMCFSFWKKNFSTLLMFNHLFWVCMCVCTYLLIYFAVGLFAIYFGQYSFIRYMVCKHFLPFYGLYFCFLMISFDLQKLFSLMYSHLFMFAFVAWGFIIPSKKKKKPIAKTSISIFSLCFLSGVL